jgi:hypothetical protein
MKVIFNTLILLVIASTGLVAQHSYGPYSPKFNLRQEVGSANIAIETTRPIARGREIFGGLVPYDELWFTGAGGTFITIDRDVTIAGQFAPASRYGLYLIPTKKEWTVILSRNSVMPDSPDYDPEQEVRVCVPVTQPGHFYEAWTIELDLIPGGANMYLSWTDAQVVVPIETSMLKDNNAFIDSLATAPLSANQEEYYRAVNYLNFNKQQPEKVVYFANHIVTLEDENRYYIHEILASAYQQLGEKKKALAALDEVMEILPREFPGQTETINSISDRVAKKRKELAEME